MEVTELPPAEVAKVRAKVKPVVDKFSRKSARTSPSGSTPRSRRSAAASKPSRSPWRESLRHGLSATSPSLADMPKVRIAVAGAGAIGLRHVEEIRKSRCAQLASIVDISPKAAEVARSADVPLYASLGRDVRDGQARRRDPRDAQPAPRRAGTGMRGGARAHARREAHCAHVRRGPAPHRGGRACEREDPRRPSSPPQPDPAQGGRDRALRHPRPARRRDGQRGVLQARQRRLLRRPERVAARSPAAAPS